LQREVRAALLRAGVEWWECRSAHAAMWALCEAGVTFRTIPRHDGGIECWRQPKLAPWEMPRRDPAQPRPNALEVAARRRRQRALKAAKLAAERNDAAGDDIAA
jgi:hypothetical protein